MICNSPDLPLMLMYVRFNWFIYLNIYLRILAETYQRDFARPSLYFVAEPSASPRDLYLSPPATRETADLMWPAHISEKCEYASINAVWFHNCRCMDGTVTNSLVALGF